MYICQLNVIIIKYNNIQQQQNDIVQWKENFDLNLYSNNSTGKKYRQIVETNNIQKQQKKWTRSIGKIIYRQKKVRTDRTEQKHH